MSNNIYNIALSNNNNNALAKSRTNNRMDSSIPSISTASNVMIGAAQLGLTSPCLPEAMLPACCNVLGQVFGSGNVVARFAPSS